MSEAPMTPEPAEVPDYIFRRYNMVGSIWTHFNFNYDCKQSIIDYRNSHQCLLMHGILQGYRHHALRIAQQSTVCAYSMEFIAPENETGAALKIETGAHAFCTNFDFSQHGAVAVKVDSESGENPKGSLTLVNSIFGSNHEKASIVCAGGTQTTIIGCDITGGDIWAYSHLTLIDCSVETKVRYAEWCGPPRIIRPRGDILVEPK